MGWRFSRRIRVLPGVRINLSRSGASLSLGGRGFTKTIGKSGIRTTVGIPGTGIFHTDVEPWQGAGRGTVLACPSCHRRVAKTAQFCQHCGQPLQLP